MCIYEGLKMLEPDDYHRLQCIRYLKEVTLKIYSDQLTTLGILEDFKKITECIADPNKQLDRDSLTNNVAKTYKLELNNESDKARHAMILN